ncbi:MAG TPA: hypothetical protein VNJ28_08135 [Candidatus Limnocylindrales bacterium]|nr:hypothetical protein [Candidatus Limnocylindrales bacterium]
MGGTERVPQSLTQRGRLSDDDAVETMVDAVRALAPAREVRR